jgi:uncharacterized protein
MKSPEYEKLREHVFKLLATELDPRLYYHGIHHTRDYVVPAAQHLAAAEGVKGEPLTLLLTAAVLHDFGYIKQYENNEIIAASLAQEMLVDFAYTPAQIAVIKNIIMATALPQTANNLLEQIMCDADLYHLGSADFFILSDDLWRELVAFGAPLSKKQWHEISIHFVEQHDYFTKTANAEQNAGKKHNLNVLREQVNNAN